ncbi:hypothetical protein ACLKA7_006572 [Drosophila subpalustris]
MSGRPRTSSFAEGNKQSPSMVLGGVKTCTGYALSLLQSQQHKRSAVAALHSVFLFFRFYCWLLKATSMLFINSGSLLEGKSTICDWYSNFKRGRTSTEDSKRPGRPQEVIIPEIIRQVRQIVLTNRRVKVREIAETVGISTGSAVSILHVHLHMKKLNVKWVPHFLDIEQREKRVADSKSCLDMFKRNLSEFLRRYITMDETWIHHYIPESNWSSAEWREAGESRSKRVKASRWADLAPSDYYLFSNLIIWLQEKNVTPMEKLNGKLKPILRDFFQITTKKAS